MSGSFNALPVVRRWFATDGRKHPVVYFLVPVALGTAAGWFRVETHNLSALLTGSIFFSGILLTIMFQVYSWSNDAEAALDETAAAIGEAWERTRQRRRLLAIGRLYNSLAWATLVSLMLTLSLIVLTAIQPVTHPSGYLVVGSVVVAVLGAHLVAVLLTIINRLFNVTGASVARHQEKANRKSA